jgi:hypothetical protein
MAERKQDGSLKVNFAFTSSFHTHTVKDCSASVKISLTEKWSFSMALIIILTLS